MAAISQSLYLSTAQPPVIALKDLKARGHKTGDQGQHSDPIHQNYPLPVPWPTEPRKLEAVGLPQTALEELILKWMFQHGVLEGVQLAADLCLPFVVVEPLLNQIAQALRIIKDPYT